MYCTIVQSVTLRSFIATFCPADGTSQTRIREEPGDEAADVEIVQTWGACHLNFVYC